MQPFTEVVEIRILLYEPVVTHIPGLHVVGRSDIVPWQVIAVKRNARLVPHTHSRLYIIFDGRSRGIVRTDPIPKPGVSSTLPSKKNEMM